MWRIWSAEAVAPVERPYRQKREIGTRPRDFFRAGRRECRRVPQRGCHRRVPQESTAGGHHIELLRGQWQSRGTNVRFDGAFRLPFSFSSPLSFSHLHVSPPCNPLYPSISILHWKDSSSSHPCLSGAPRCKNRQYETFSCKGRAILTPQTERWAGTSRCCLRPWVEAEIWKSNVPSRPNYW